VLVVPPRLDVLVDPLRAALDGGEPVLVTDDQHVVEAARLDEPCDAALLVATSGTTGAAKVVELSAAALLASAHATHEVLGGSGRWTLHLPLTFIAGLQVAVRSIAAGPDASRRYTAVVPTQLRRMMADLRGFDAVLVGGASTPPALLAEARQAGVNVVTTYGMTETCGGCVYDGTALPGVTWRIEETIVIGGATVADGYRGGVRFVGEFRTADLGAVGPDGRLVVLGRADDVIVSGGVNVHPDTVAAALIRQPGVRDCAVAGVPDAEWGQAVVAWVVGHVNPTELRAAVRAELGPATPKAVHLVPAIPMLPSGKPDRRALLAGLG
jgi:O-succinylbenzoic acid--CoA ligase